MSIWYPKYLRSCGLPSPFYDEAVVSKTAHIRSKKQGSNTKEVFNPCKHVDSGFYISLTGVGNGLARKQCFVTFLTYKTVD